MSKLFDQLVEMQKIEADTIASLQDTPFNADLRNRMERETGFTEASMIYVQYNKLKGQAEICR